MSNKTIGERKNEEIGEREGEGVEGGKKGMKVFEI